MTITKKIIYNEKGEPSEVIIPYDQFLHLSEFYRRLIENDVEDAPTASELEAMLQADADREAGNKEAFTDLSDLKAEFSL